MVMVPYDRNKARTDVIEIFSALLTDPSIIASPSKHLSTLQSMSATLPAVLKPTKAQLQNPHYYAIDMIASPSLRDKLINVGGEVAKSFIQDFGNCDGEDIDRMIIWGEDAMNERAWEFSQQILERWGWLLGAEWVARANFWRRQRGAPLLSEW